MTIPPFSQAQLEAFAKILGDQFTSSELGRLLDRAKLPDLNPGDAKWRRLLAIFERVQRQCGVGSHVGTILQVAFEPVLRHDRSEQFESARNAVNRSLAFSGLSIGEDGELRRLAAARILTEAEERAGRLRAALERRDVHPDVLRFCRAELLEESYSHAVLEAAKSVVVKLREKSGLASDGSDLVDQVFGGQPDHLPRLAFSALQTPTQWSEHRGMMNLMKGMFGAFRNPAAHEAKMDWPVGEQDALDLLTLASLLHRRLDAAVRTSA